MILSMLVFCCSGVQTIIVIVIVIAIIVIAIIAIAAIFSAPAIIVRSELRSPFAARRYTSCATVRSLIALHSSSAVTVIFAVTFTLTQWLSGIVSFVDQQL